MFTKLISPKDYLWLGMRENIYLVTAVLLVCCILSYVVYLVFEKISARWLLSSFAVQTVVMSIVIGLNFVFLRPISQFIYFQF